MVHGYPVVDCHNAQLNFPLQLLNHYDCNVISVSQAGHSLCVSFAGPHQQVITLMTLTIIHSSALHHGKQFVICGIPVVSGTGLHFVIV